MLDWKNPLSISRKFEIFIFGFPLFGTWLPFIGFDTIVKEDFEGNELEEYKVFVIEWFGYAIILYNGDKDL